MQRNRRFKQTAPLEDRLALEAQRLRDEALRAGNAQERDALLRRARQTETAADVNDWLSSPRLQSPR